MGSSCFLDASAVVALLLNEPGAPDLKVHLRRFSHLKIGAPTAVEILIVLSGRSGKDERLRIAGFLQQYEVEVEAFGPHHYQLAADAFLRYGKGRHPARLNFGDCLAYAGATLAGLPLLYVGNDFALTDIQPAITSR